MGGNVRLALTHSTLLDWCLAFTLQTTTAVCGNIYYRVTAVAFRILTPSSLLILTLQYTWVTPGFLLEGAVIVRLGIWNPQLSLLWRRGATRRCVTSRKPAKRLPSLWLSKWVFSRPPIHPSTGPTKRRMPVKLHVGSKPFLQGQMDRSADRWVPEECKKPWRESRVQRR